MNKFAAALGAALLAFGLGAPAADAAAPAATASASCAVHWGSLPKSIPTLSQATVQNVRAGRHGCFDRLVIDLHGKVAGYNVRYVDQVLEQGSGRPVPLRGGAFLEVTVTSPAYDASGHPTYVPANPSEVVNVGGFVTFREVAWAGSFEGYTSLGLGVRARLPFRVFILGGRDGGSRLVVDVAHRW
ncbi:hypothetical protein SPF06_11860 [Sinomonas sp. JGH33]|uniref:AMIN-like domain-containing protein n=1 Tax=Sinomonas terricola TaxID=3110330 RepID=A0ABU5T6W9_9MICC|nr:hypothetical protein [Sinomonas sp. JGH33]MEA5455418.1 hypothetical protein [Sinomonas sp. JGH33]